MRAIFVACAFAALTAACAPVVHGGAPIELPLGLRDTARIGAIYVSSEWLRSEEDFSDTLGDEVREELQRCMVGARPLDARIHIDDLERAGRFETLFTGEGAHVLKGTVEFTDPRNGDAIVGRFPVEVATTAQGRIGALIGDRQMMVAEEFGRALCEQAFGRNPRSSGLHNATRG